jgi:hypothetical protein
MSHFPIGIVSTWRILTHCGGSEQIDRRPILSPPRRHRLARPLYQRLVSLERLNPTPTCHAFRRAIGLLIPLEKPHLFDVYFGARGGEWDRGLGRVLGVIVKG